MLARLVSVSEECQTDSGVSAPGPGARRRSSGELVRTRTKVRREEGGQRDEGAGRDPERTRLEHRNFTAVVWWR